MVGGFRPRRTGAGSVRLQCPPAIPSRLPLADAWHIRHTQAMTSTTNPAEAAEALAHVPEVQAAAKALRPENFERWLTANLARLLRAAR